MGPTSTGSATGSGAYRGADQLELRSAVGTGDRLGVEAPVARVVVLGAQAGHIANPAIVVASRSYGRPVMMVKRGPQLVQVTNGWRYRR
jgi:hypothetical protein